MSRRRRVPYTRASKVTTIDVETGAKVGTQRAYTPQEYRRIVAKGQKATPTSRATKRRDHAN